jgi:hypothetical protein
MKTDTPLPSMPNDTEFDLRVRAEMALAFEPGGVPAELLRQPRPWRTRLLRRLAAGLVLVAAGSGTVLAMRPPALVRDAIEHESHERVLRGSVADPRQFLTRFSLGTEAPGFAQLMRVCDIEGHVAYHLTTYFDKGGMVTAFAFDKPVELRDAAGWWNGVHWRVIRARDGRPLVLVSANSKALGVAQASFKATTLSAPG